MLEKGNLFEGIPEDLREEAFTDLLRGHGVRIERIVSRGQASPPGFWYDQETDEWVLLLKGRARLLFESGREIALGPGDYLWIPRHERHRVEETAPEGETLWLAVHIDGV